MRSVVTLALIASLACSAAEPSEAMSFDRPIRVINERNEVRWISDGGTCLSPPAWAKVDESFKALQTVKHAHESEPNPAAWFFAGAATGAAIVLAGAIVVYAVTR